METRHACGPRLAADAPPAYTGDPSAPGELPDISNPAAKPGKAASPFPGTRAKEEAAVSLPYLFSSQMEAAVAGSP